MDLRLFLDLSSRLRIAAVFVETLLYYGVNRSNPAHPLSHKAPASPTVQLNKLNTDSARVIILVAFLDADSLRTGFLIPLRYGRGQN